MKKITIGFSIASSHLLAFSGFGDFLHMFYQATQACHFGYDDRLCAARPSECAL